MPDVWLMNFKGTSQNTPWNRLILRCTFDLVRKTSKYWIDWLINDCSIGLDHSLGLSFVCGEIVLCNVSVVFPRGTNSRHVEFDIQTTTQTKQREKVNIHILYFIYWYKRLNHLILSFCWLIFAASVPFTQVRTTRWKLYEVHFMCQVYLLVHTISTSVSIF